MAKVAVMADIFCESLLKEVGRMSYQFRFAVLAGWMRVLRACEWFVSVR